VNAGAHGAVGAAGACEGIACALAGENVEATVIGQFGTKDRELVLHYRGEAVGRLSMHFLHDGLPMPTRKAIVKSGVTAKAPATSSVPFTDQLLTLLAHPNIASKHWIIRQYDHEYRAVPLSNR